MFNLLTLPRASWNARRAFTILAVVFIGLIVQQWPHRPDELVIARWMAWLCIVIGVFTLPRVLVVVVLGRLPKVYARMPGNLNRTLPQIHAGTVGEKQDQRGRSCEL